MPKTISKSDLEMIHSCYTYGFLGSDYMKNIYKKYGKKIVEKEIKNLEDNYTIEYGTYEDSEGCVYNTLIKK